MLHLRILDPCPIKNRSFLEKFNIKQKNNSILQLMQVLTKLNVNPFDT